MPERQTTPSQHPPLHWLGPLQNDEHVPLLQASPCGQSEGPLQPHDPFTQAWPFGFAVQSTQAPPEPQEVAVVPATHMFPWQQEPGPHGVRSVHIAVHMPDVQVGVVPLHAAHAKPVAPHLSFAVPGWQCIPSQQPPLQGELAEQFGEHWCVVGSQAWPVGQSVGRTHPGGPSSTMTSSEASGRGPSDGELSPRVPSPAGPSRLPPSA